eukprot:9819144-Karenia_brevis.AAC.1
MKACAESARNILLQVDGECNASDMLLATCARILATNDSKFFRCLAPIHSVVRSHLREGRWGMELIDPDAFASAT